MTLALLDWGGFGATALQVTAWTVLAAALLVGALKVFDLLTPGKLHDQVFTERNVAAAVVYGAALIAFAIVISAAMH